MTYTFEDAKPVKIQGTGAKKIDNPFLEAVASIAWKTDDKTGQPKALSFVEEHGPDDTKAIRARLVGLLTRAGDALETPGTVRRDFADVKDGDKIVGTKTTFWVIEKKRIVKNKTAKTSAETEKK